MSSRTKKIKDFWSCLWAWKSILVEIAEKKLMYWLFFWFFELFLNWTDLLAIFFNDVSLKTIFILCSSRLNWKKIKLILNLANFLDSENQALGRFWKYSKTDVSHLDVWLFFSYRETRTFLTYSFIGHL